MRIRRRLDSLRILAAGVLLAGACGEEGTAPSTSLVGNWQLVGFSDAGVAAVTTGTWVFRADGSFSVNGTIAFPGEPADPLVLSGTYAQNENAVTLSIAGQTTIWTVIASGNEVTLTENESPPANSITLRRA